jgi:Bacterial TSP3 repeat
MTKTRVITFAVAALGAMLLIASSAAAKDRNRDGISDRWEKKFDLSLKVDQANKDQDRDKVDNLNEFQEGTNPRDKDTDNDGVKDGREDGDHDGLNNQNEDASANMPDDPDTDNDGVEDGDEVVGTIASFQDPVLTIDLLGGGSVTGNVTASTRIQCRTEDEQENENEVEDHAVASHDGGASDDNEGPGSDNQGPGDGAVCTAADLTAGTMVHEAELEGSSFETIELVQ